MGLPQRVSILIACGNSICGNSAIAAVAPVIGADSDDVASSIAFTAILGVIVVLGLPLFIPLLRLSETQYGVLAGLTVYAVPQVLAATVPISAVSAQLGTLVKLVRVLMLGPVIILLSLLRSKLNVSGRRHRTACRLAVIFFRGSSSAFSRSRRCAVPDCSGRFAGADRDHHEMADDHLDGGPWPRRRCPRRRPGRWPRHGRRRDVARRARRDQREPHLGLAHRVREGPWTSPRASCRLVRYGRT